MVDDLEKQLEEHAREDEVMEKKIEKLLTPSKARDEAFKLEARFKSIEEAMSKLEKEVAHSVENQMK